MRFKLYRIFNTRELIHSESFNELLDIGKHYIAQSKDDVIRLAMNDQYIKVLPQKLVEIDVENDPRYQQNKELLIQLMEEKKFYDIGICRTNTSYKDGTKFKNSYFDHDSLKDLVHTFRVSTRLINESVQKFLLNTEYLNIPIGALRKIDNEEEKYKQYAIQILANNFSITEDTANNIYKVFKSMPKKRNLKPWDTFHPKEGYKKFII